MLKYCRGEIVKKYYQTLNKEQKNKIKEIFKNEYQNTPVNARFSRLLMYSIVGILFSGFMLIEYFVLDNKNIGNIIIGLTLLIASITFLIGRYRIKLRYLNKIALKNK